MKRTWIFLLIIGFSLMMGCAQIKARVASGQWADDTRLGLHVAYVVVSVMCLTETLDDDDCELAASYYMETLELLDRFTQEPSSRLRDEILENIEIMEALPQGHHIPERETRLAP